ncbi:MAG: THUMP domain-containing protein, partial [Candidatus Poseidoniia archaeon]
MRFEGGMLDAWRANLWLRTAVRILWRLEQFEALDDDALYTAVRKIDWTRFVGPEGSICVSAQTRDSLLDHSRFIEQRTKDAIVDDLRDRTGARPNVDRDSADLNIHIHIFNNRVTLSIDTSGASLHKRGWRRYQGRAPLAETLAAGILQLSGWDQRSPLVDPFCGSGTFLVEAALAAFDAQFKQDSAGKMLFDKGSVKHKAMRGVLSSESLSDTDIVGLKTVLKIQNESVMEAVIKDQIDIYRAQANDYIRVNNLTGKRK